MEVRGAQSVTLQVTEDISCSFLFLWYYHTIQTIQSFMEFLFPTNFWNKCDRCKGGFVNKAFVSTFCESFAVQGHHICSQSFWFKFSILDSSLHINVVRSSSLCLYKAVETFTDNIRPEARYKHLTKLLLQFSQSWGELRYEHSVFVSSKSYRVGAKIGFWFLLTVNGYWTDQAKGCLNIFQAGFQTPKSAQ